GSTGKHEALQLGKVGVEPVAVLLELVDLVLRHAQPAIPHPVRDAEIRTHVEQLVLNALEDATRVPFQVARQRETDVRVQLVDGSEGADPAIELRSARAVAEAGLPLVAAARVDAGQANRLIDLARHPSRLRAMIRRATPGDAAEVSRVF